MEERVNKLIEELKQDPSVKLLLEPVRDVLKEEKSVDIDLEMVAFQLLLAVKLKDETILKNKFNLNAKELIKLSRYVTKPAVKDIVEALEVLLNDSDLASDYKEVIGIIKEGFDFLNEGGKPKPVSEKNNSKKIEEYDNPNLKEVLVQLESNESVVYLLTLVNRAYADELSLTRVNRALAALEIMVSLREEGENKYIEFGKMTLEEFRTTMKGSISLEIVHICLDAVMALQARISSVEGYTPSVVQKISQLKDRFEHIQIKLRES